MRPQLPSDGQQNGSRRSFLELSGQFRVIKRPVFHAGGVDMARPKNATVDEAKQDNQTAQQNKPIIDQMADLAAGAAGALVETAVKAAASRATAAVAKRAPASLKKAAKTVGRAS